MMSAHDERARLLSIAIDRATRELQAPIDEVEVTSGQVLCRAGSRVLTMSYGYADAIHADGSVRPGSGSWWVEVESASAPREAKVAWALGRVAGKWLKAKGLRG